MIGEVFCSIVGFSFLQSDGERRERVTNIYGFGRDCPSKTERRKAEGEEIRTDHDLLSRLGLKNNEMSIFIDFLNFISRINLVDSPLSCSFLAMARRK